MNVTEENLKHIMIETGKKFAKIECSDIGNLEKRKCARCQSVVDYKYYIDYLRAIRKNTKCKKCASIGVNSGRIPSIETKRRMSRSQLGRKHSDGTKKKMSGKGNGMFGIYRCGEDNPFYGKNHSEKSKIKMRKAALTRALLKGGANVGKK
jgi:hypothetical protein